MHFSGQVQIENILHFDCTISSKILLEILVCACLLTMLGSFVDFGAMIHDAVEPEVEAILKEVLPAWTGVRSMPDAF